MDDSRLLHRFSHRTDPADRWNLFATVRFTGLTPYEFFGTAFWIGFVLTSSLRKSGFNGLDHRHSKYLRYTCERKPIMAMLDHLIVPSHDRKPSAKLLADLLGVKSGESFGLFSAVYVNETLTIDFMQGDKFDVHHYCFSVTDEEFETILARLRENKIPYRSSPHGPMDMKINTDNGGKNLYWFDSDGHNWEILTVSYARPRASVSSGS
jgi:hypothetical protein